jgi:hypothetical protein
VLVVLGRPHRGIVAVLTARPNIQFLYWHDAAGKVDQRSTRLGTVRLDGAGLGCVRLPDTLTSLLLTRPPVGLEVEAPNDGRGLDLRLFQYGPDVVIPDGPRRASQLWLWVGSHVSAGVLAQLTDLTSLRLTFDKPPGVITKLAERGRHTGLHTLQPDDAFGLIDHPQPRTRLDRLQRPGPSPTRSTGPGRKLVGHRPPLLGAES